MIATTSGCREKLARQVPLFDVNPRVGLTCTDTEVFNASGTLSRMFEKSRPVRGMAFRELISRQWISMSSAMIRMSALQGLDEWIRRSLNVCEEADVFYRIAKNWELDYVDAPLTRWRVHDVNTTFRKFGQFADETKRILNKHRRLYSGYEREYPDLVELLTRRAAFQKAVALWREGEGHRARLLVAPYQGFVQGAFVLVGLMAARQPFRSPVATLFQVAGISAPMTVTWAPDLRT